MAVPFRKVSKTRGRKRRTHYVISANETVKCPKCGEGTIVERKSKRGTVFYGCDKYPNCDFTLWNEPTGEKCPEENNHHDIISGFHCRTEVQCSKQ